MLFYRYHAIKDKFSNLNSVGCDFTDIKFYRTRR